MLLPFSFHNTLVLSSMYQMLQQNPMAAKQLTMTPPNTIPLIPSPTESPSCDTCLLTLAPPLCSGKTISWTLHLQWHLQQQPSTPTAATMMTQWQQQCNPPLPTNHCPSSHTIFPHHTLIKKQWWPACDNKPLQKFLTTTSWWWWQPQLQWQWCHHAHQQPKTPRCPSQYHHHASI